MRYCQEINDGPGSARLMKIMAKQATNKVPNGQHTLKELFRVHFPDSKLVDDLYADGQGQQNLGVCGRIMNREDWNLARHVNNQPQIRWALGTVKPLSLREQIELYRHFCSKGWNIYSRLPHM
jgi:hypothetical protein